MFKLEIKDQKDNITKLMTFFDGSIKINDYVVLERTNKGQDVEIHAGKTADGKSVVFSFHNSRPVCKLAGVVRGEVERIIVNTECIKVVLDGLPDVTVPVVS
jgi:hypothetical protein